MIMWILIIYTLMSLMVMSVVKPWKDDYYNPVFMTIFCFLIGGAIFILVMIFLPKVLYDKLFLTFLYFI